MYYQILALLHDVPNAIHTLVDALEVAALILDVLLQLSLDVLFLVCHVPSR